MSKIEKFMFFSRKLKADVRFYFDDFSLQRFEL